VSEHTSRLALALALLSACSADDTSPAAAAAPAPAATNAPPPTRAPRPPETAPAETPPGKVPMFVAIGHAGRITVSCDDGKTWIANQSADDKLRCFDPAVTPDCDHNGLAGRGITYESGFFIANFGWGAPGRIRRSRDGVTWETVLEGANFASTVAGNGKVIAVSGEPQVSTDLGMTWRPGGRPEFGARRAGFGAGLFLMIGDGPKAAITADGQSWKELTALPPACGKEIQWTGGVLGLGSALVIAGEDGVVCASTDGGASWKVEKIAERLEGELVRSGGALCVWGTSTGTPSRATLFRSTNGIDWTATPTVLRGTTAGAPIGPVAVGNSGTFVAVSSGWGAWYESQKFFRSTDGVTWDELPAGAFVQSHPINHIVAGDAEPSTLCPAPR